MNKNDELLKFAAANIVRKYGLEKEAGTIEGLLTLLALGGMGWAATKIWPDKWADLKDKLLGAFGLTRSQGAAPPASTVGQAATTTGSTIANTQTTSGAAGKPDKKRLGVKPEQGQKPKRTVAYTVRPGDTLSSIARRYYGDATQWNRISDFAGNQISNPDVINTGSILRVPIA